METITYHTNKDGSVKYYASYHTAWNAAIRLNQNTQDGTWLFDGDEHGWYLHLEADA
jgi:hypothetical protein